MHAPARSAVVARLRETIEGLERHWPRFGPSAPSDAALPFSRLAPDGVHELRAPSGRDGGALLGFALGQAAGRLSPARPALIWLQLAHEAAETGLPYPPGFGLFGIPAEAMAFVRTSSAKALLWAAEEAACCPAVAVVIADMLSRPVLLDFTASRRLALRSAKSVTPVFLLRYGPDREASAAATRWRIESFPSLPHPHDPRAPGPSRWRATLEKAPRGQRGQWILSWSGTQFVEDGYGHGTDGIPFPSYALGDAAPAGAAFPALGDRLSQAG